VAHVIVWDIESIPDLAGFAAANGLSGKTDDEIRAEIGDKFPKPLYHSIVCIGALVAERRDDGWHVLAAGAPHVGERSESELIKAFVDRIGDLRPQLVTYNGSRFDLPVLRYRAMLHKLAAPGLFARNYFNRYTDDAIDLCDVLSSFQPASNVKLDELSKLMGLPGKPAGISGSEVEEFYREGKIQDIADYCLSDVVNTYRLWLRYELFRGALAGDAFAASEERLAAYTERRHRLEPGPQSAFSARSETLANRQTP
jgi:predicted PolB exonuclease-like 3'-5' exonuclease